MKKFFTKLFASAMIVSMAFSMFVSTAKAVAIHIIGGVQENGVYGSVTPYDISGGYSIYGRVVDGMGVSSWPYITAPGRHTVSAYSSLSNMPEDISFTISNARVHIIGGVQEHGVYESVAPYDITGNYTIYARTVDGQSVNNWPNITTEGLHTVSAYSSLSNVPEDISFTIKHGVTPPVNPPVTPPVENPVNPVVGIIKTAKSTVKVAKAATITPVAESTCAVPCADPFDAILKDVNTTEIENADGLGGNLNSCRNVRITGHAQDGLLVILYIEKNGSDVPMIGFVKAGAGDEYQFVTDKPLAAGDYTVFAKLAQEGGKTGPMIEVGSFHVERCNRLVVWMWLLIILIVLIIAGLIGWFMSRRRHVQKEMDENEEDIFGDIDETTETTDADAIDSHEDRL